MTPAARDPVPDLLLSTWDLRPFREDGDVLVAVLRRGTVSPERPAGARAP